jgi:hypothetical protein
MGMPNCLARGAEWGRTVIKRKGSNIVTGQRWSGVCVDKITDAHMTIVVVSCG